MEAQMNRFSLAFMRIRGQRWNRLWIIGLLSFFILLVLFFSTSKIIPNQQYTELATAFLDGQLSFSHETLIDRVEYNGRFYFAPGPGPAVLMMPMVGLARLFGFRVTQEYLNIGLVGGLCLIWFFIGRRLKYQLDDSLYWSFGFLFGSTMIGVILAPVSWYLAQVVTVFFLSLALLEWLGKSRFYFIGLFLALAVAARPTVVMGSLFFLWVIAQQKEEIRIRLKQTVQLITPLFIVGLVLLTYNFMRFGNPFESGYGLIQNDGALAQAHTYGVFSPAHVAGNLYYFLLNPPVPVFRDGISKVLKPPFFEADPWGMSIVVTSPFLLKLFFISYRQHFAKALLLTSLFIAIPIFLYYGIGYLQYGYRYALDFFPFLYVLLMRGCMVQRTRLSLGMRGILSATGLINLHLFMTFFASQAGH